MMAASYFARVRLRNTLAAGHERIGAPMCAGAVRHGPAPVDPRPARRLCRALGSMVAVKAMSSDSSRPSLSRRELLGTAAAGSAVLAVAYALPFAYFAWSLVWGRRAPGNPWDATGLEWRTASPPPTHNFDQPPTVDVGPYDYHPEAQAPEPGQRPGRRQGEHA